MRLDTKMRQAMTFDTPELALRGFVRLRPVVPDDLAGRIRTFDSAGDAFTAPDTR